MMDSLRKGLRNREIGNLIAKFLFLLVALVSLYKAVTITEWWQAIPFLGLVLICGLLISGGYEDVKFTVMKLIGMEVTSPQENGTAKEIQDLLKDRDTSDLTAVDVNEDEGRYQVQFERD
ncbi:hypothetical protein [Natrinema limicola]|uniref:hypothetical protein n=1 Tax=Natrinema limicola TaxID=370323 RepID=UPI0012674433|nr:hypothetical protein [Natrinema limicola]